MKLSNRLFDVLKWVAILFLPALAILIRTVFAIWKIPYGEEISSTIVALQVFLGAVLGVSTLNYNKEA
ncbi:MAG: phage holin [Acutalibacteraceae bacterium]|nr:phage holin [Acutalibacteraceae bacterium]